MVRVAQEQLSRLTLQRQFPSVQGTGGEQVLQLLDRLGPLQSQVPRAPFVTLAARLPGSTYATICSLFESFQLFRASNLRGTVHPVADTVSLHWTPWRRPRARRRSAADSS